MRFVQFDASIISHIEIKSYKNVQMSKNYLFSTKKSYN